VTDLDLRNDENRSSLTSGTAPVAERQEESSKNTIDQLADATTGGNDIGLWPANIPERMREHWLKKWNRFSLTLRRNVIFKPWCSTTQKRNSSRNSTTSLIRRQNHNGEVVDRSWFCFPFSQVYVYSFTCRLMCAATIKRAHFLVGKGFCDWSTLLSAWGATSNQWNI